MSGTRVAIYCRVDQGGNTEIRQQALTEQYNRLKHYASHKSLQIVARYEDNGYAGNTLDRPGLTKMLADFQAGHFDTVLVINHDRLYRGNRYKHPQWPFRVWTINQPQRDMER